MLNKILLLNFDFYVVDCVIMFIINVPDVFNALDIENENKSIRKTKLQ